MKDDTTNTTNINKLAIPDNFSNLIPKFANRDPLKEAIMAALPVTLQLERKEMDGTITIVWKEIAAMLSSESSMKKASWRYVKAMQILQEYDQSSTKILRAQNEELLFSYFKSFIARYDLTISNGIMQFRTKK